MIEYYYYQRAKNPGDNDPCAGLWMCCGGVDLNTAHFYVDWFTKHDTRCGLREIEDGDYEVCIVRGYYGKCANRREFDRIEGNKAIHVMRPQLTKRDMLLWHNRDESAALVEEFARRV